MPTASTASSRRPSSRSAERGRAARGCGVSTSRRSPTSTCSRRAARWRESPSGTSEVSVRGLYARGPRPTLGDGASDRRENVDARQAHCRLRPHACDAAIGATCAGGGRLVEHARRLREDGRPAAAGPGGRGLQGRRAAVQWNVQGPKATAARPGCRSEGRPGPGERARPAPPSGSRSTTRARSTRARAARTSRRVIAHRCRRSACSRRQAAHGRSSTAADHERACRDGLPDGPRLGRVAIRPRGPVTTSGDVASATVRRASSARHVRSTCAARRSSILPGRRVVDRGASTLRAQHGAARAGEEAGLDEQRHDLRLGHRLAVEALDREPLRAAARVTCATSAASAGPQPLLVRLAQRHERPAAALDEERRLAAEQDDVRARDARGAARRPASATAARRRTAAPGRRPRARAAPASSPSLRPQLAQPLDRAAERELRAAEPLDEVAAPAEAERLERLQLAVDRAVAAGDALGADAVARDDPLPLEQQLGERAAVGRGPAKSRAGERPAALRRGDLARARGARSGAARRSARAARRSGGRARSGVQASFVTSPAQTSSQSAGSATSASSPVAARRSSQNSALRAERARGSRRAPRPRAVGAAAGGPSTGASSRK